MQGGVSLVKRVHDTWNDHSHEASSKQSTWMGQSEKANKDVKSNT